jgi:hypothetical protein
LTSESLLVKCFLFSLMWFTLEKPLIPKGWYNICTLSLTSALEGVDCQRQASASLLTEKIRYTFYRRRTGPHDRPDGSENLI